MNVREICKIILLFVVLAFCRKLYLIYLFLEIQFYLILIMPAGLFF